MRIFYNQRANQFVIGQMLALVDGEVPPGAIEKNLPEVHLSDPGWRDRRRGGRFSEQAVRRHTHVNNIHGTRFVAVRELGLVCIMEST